MDWLHDPRLLTCAWSGMAFASVLVHAVPALGCIALHGKAASPAASAWLTVPKSYFTHMYLVGLLALVPFYSSVLSACLALHFLRRLGECLFLTSYGDSRMHVGGYLAGLAHYLLLPLSVHVALGDARAEGRPHWLAALAALLLFAVCSYCQHLVHAHLAALKALGRCDKDGSRYPLPRGPLFALVACPHYSCEVGIYASLWLLRPSSTVLLALLLWVATNLAVVASRQLQWYRATYGSAVPGHWGGWLPCVCRRCLWGGSGGRGRAGGLRSLGLALLLLLPSILAASSAPSASRRIHPRPPTPRRLHLSANALPDAPSSWTAQAAGLSQDELMLKDMCVLVDPSDAIIGQASKYDAHRFTPTQPQGLLHRAFSVFLFDSQGRLLLQRRAADKLTFPGVWTNTCCSHPLYGYSPGEVDGPQELAAGRCPGVMAAAVRKLQHELGIPPAAVPTHLMRYLTRLRYSAPDPAVLSGRPEEREGWGESEVDYIIFLRAQLGAAELQPNPEEASEVRYVTQAELRAMLADPSLHWSPWFRIIVDRFLWRWWSDLEGVDAGRHADPHTIHAF